MLTSSYRRRRWGLAAALLVACLDTVGAGERLGTDAIAAAFKGMSLDGVYRNGEFFSETYAEDGTIRYHGLGGADRGEWSAASNRFCTFYEGANGGCFFVERDGDNCFTFFLDEGGATPRPAADWTSRGWDRSRKATCPAAPEVQL